MPEAFTALGLFAVVFQYRELVAQKDEMKSQTEQFLETNKMMREERSIKLLNDLHHELLSDFLDEYYNLIYRIISISSPENEKKGNQESLSFIRRDIKDCRKYSKKINKFVCDKNILTREKFVSIFTHPQEQERSKLKSNLIF